MVASRRAFIGYGSALAGGLAAGWWSVGLIEYIGSASSDTPWKALTPEEADTLDRIAEEIIPADPPSAENGDNGIPGAHDAKVVRFIDWQLAKDAPYERHLPDYRRHLAAAKSLSAADLERQSPEFFRLLVSHVKQGFYGHPCHGGNADWSSFRMLGIAGPSVTGRNVPGKENHL